MAATPDGHPMTSGVPSANLRTPGDRGRGARLATRGPRTRAPRPSSRAWRALRRDPLALAATIVLLFVIVFCAGASLISQHITHFGYAEQDLTSRLVAPGTEVTLQHLGTDGELETVTRTYWLGADELGRDILTRLAYGGRISLAVAAGSLILALTLGLITGVAAGYLGGIVDSVIMRVVDMVLSIPSLFILLLISALVNNSAVITGTALYENYGWLLLPVAISLISWTTLARLVRGEVRLVKEQEYVAAARVLGVRTSVLIRRHVLRNIMPVVVIWSALAVPILIILEAGISFLGFGARVPTPSWGNMLSRSTSVFLTAPHVVIAPGLAILVTTMAVNFMANALRDAFDPRRYR